MSRASRRPIAYRFIAIALAATAVVFGSLALSMHGAVHHVSAQVAGQHLELAPAESSVWTAALDGSWLLADAAPGDLATGALQLRSIDPPAGASLRFFATATRDSELLAYLRVTSIWLGEQNLGGAWDGCTGGATLTLADLIECKPPALPLPAAGAGETFVMTVAFDAGAGNALQGLRTGPVTFVFALDVPGGTETPTPSPSEGTPTAGTETPEPTATATAIDTVDGVDTPGAGTPTVTATSSATATGTIDSVAGSRVPSVPSAGSGSLSGANDTTLALFAGIAITSWIAGIVLLAASRRRRSDG